MRVEDRFGVPAETEGGVDMDARARSGGTAERRSEKLERPLEQHRHMRAAWLLHRLSPQ
jgi:hypothetical protein